MKAIRGAVICSAISLAGQAVAAQQVAGGPEPRPSPLVTFEQAVSRAAANQPLVLRAEAEARSARAKVGEVESEYLPRLDLQAGYDRLQPKQELDIGGGSAQLVPQNSMDFHLGAGMLLYDFGRRSLRERIAKDGLDSAIIGVDSARQGIAYRAARAYYGLVALKRELKALDEEKAFLDAYIASARKKETEGSATRIDALAAQVRAASAEDRRIEAAAEFGKRKIALAQMMGLPLGADFDVEEDYAPERGAGDPQALLATALASRPEVQAALKEENAAKLGRTLAAEGGRPSLTLRGQAGYRNGILDSASQSPSALVFNWDLGLTLTMPVFDGRRTARQADEASGNAEAAHQGSEEQRRAVTTQVLQALQGLSSSRERVANAGSRIERAQQYFDLSKTRYELGAGDGIEYLDALDALSLAKLGVVGARLDEALSDLDLRQALGDRLWSAR